MLAVCAGLLKHPASQFDDLPGLLGERDEHRRRDRAARRVVPAQQRFHSADPAIGGVDDRLVVEVQLAAADRSGQATRQAGVVAGEMQLAQVEHVWPPTRSRFDRYIARSASRNSSSGDSSPDR